VLDPAGQSLAQGMAISDEIGTVVAELITPPQAGQYSILVRRAGQSTGGFGLIALPGFGGLSVVDYFDGTSDSAFTWCDCQEPTLTTRIVNGEYLMEIPVIDNYWTIRPNETIMWESMYAEVTVHTSEQVRYFGLVLRFSESEQGENQFYAVGIGRGGTWSIFAVHGTEFTPISPRQESPVIDMSQPNPRIGVLVDGYTFTLFFNGQVVGQATDPEQRIPAGEFGFVLDAGTEPEWVPAQVYFDNLVITTPLAAENSAPGSGIDIGGLLDSAGDTGTDLGPLGIGQKSDRVQLPDSERASSFNLAHERE
jgi:hypothetical protein